jgi:hypothetical protein
MAPLATAQISPSSGSAMIAPSTRDAADDAAKCFAPGHVRRVGAHLKIGLSALHHVTSF